MIANPSVRFCFAILLFLTTVCSNVSAQKIGPDLYQEMRWRMIGPFRGGRTVGATGVPGQPALFYIGVNNGGVWKTVDYGHIWKPIFDQQPTGSIGALAVAPSNPEIIYVGSGEGLQRPDLSTGDGVYKSTGGGRTWQHLGLRDGQQISAIVVDPGDANRVFVAVLGHPYGPNQERGVFRSMDGGQNWQKVLYKDEDTGAASVIFDPTNTKTLYADLWSSRQGPWENGAWQGPGSGLYKSTDGGATWRQLTKGLPTFAQGLGRIGITVAPSDANRLYATVDSPQLGGIYRSDDAGETWRRVNSERRVWGRGGDFAEVKVDPRNSDTVFLANTSTYRSTDGGQTFTAFKGSPGGDDYHTIWINPDNPKIMLLAGDQGAVITVNGGETWSSWYNQPTAQFYHVSTDNQFPYWVYGGQQESGSVGISSRGDNGAITFRDWRTVGAEEYGYVASDPLNPDIIYGGKLSRFDKSTGQVQNVAPETLRGKYRFLRTAPVIFSPVDPHILYFAGNVLFKTLNGGQSWQLISPDLSRETAEVPASVGVFRTPEMTRQPRRGVIYTVAPSPKDLNTIWVGTDDGLIHLTADGGQTWNSVTPPQVNSWSKVSLLDASHFDLGTAYAAVNRIRLDDQRPHIYRTHDRGKTWTEIINGLPENGPVNTVREDPLRKGLLFAGTERAVYVSFDDGNEWLPLRLNMPATSIRDLVVHNDDLVVGTHGRSFWILDDITPLRQISEQVTAAEAHLFEPQVSYRLKRDVNTDTPLPPEEPAGKNPPDGAIIDYYLKSNVSGSVTLEIFDQSNQLVRKFSGADQPSTIDPKEYTVTPQWFRPPQSLSAKQGMHRFVWDLNYPPPPALRYDYPISAIYGDTPAYPLGPAVIPGDYAVKLTVAGKSYTQHLVVKLDPRVKLSTNELEQQFSLSFQVYRAMGQTFDALEQIKKLRERIKDLKAQKEIGSIAEALTSLDQKAVVIEGEGRAEPSAPGAPDGPIDVRDPDLTKLSTGLTSLLELLQSADASPTTQARAAVAELQLTLTSILGRWRELKSSDVKAINERLRQARLPILD